jgi:UDP-N-acetylglucosamine 1-carboxyvinyltransferase
MMQAMQQHHEATSIRRAASAGDYLTVHGGRPLVGEVSIRGAKNSLPKVMVATLLTSEPCVIRNVAAIQDVDVVSEMLTALGGTVAETAPGTLTISMAGLEQPELGAMKPFAGRSRIPMLFCGPLLARFGEAEVPGLGGCRIGPRPVNFHINALKSFGAAAHTSKELTFLRAPKLAGCKIRLDYPSVGATEQVLLTAVLAEGVTELSNAAIEPEIVDLVCVLQKMGAIISLDNNRVITVVGVPRLGGFDHAVMPDRLEAASWACAAAATDGKIFVRHARQLDMITFLNKFRQIGGEFEIGSDGIEFWRGKAGLRSTVIETDVHPGFMTDWQQPFLIALTQAEGVSVVHETVYEDRFGYITALNEMGAQIQLYRECLGGIACRFGQQNHLHSAVIAGPRKLTAANITIPDLRAGFTYVIAALAAQGTSNVFNVGIIRRGYEDFFNKLRALGAGIETP